MGDVLNSTLNIYSANNLLAKTKDITDPSQFLTTLDKTEMYVKSAKEELPPHIKNPTIFSKIGKFKNDALLPIPHDFFGRHHQTDKRRISTV